MKYKIYDKVNKEYLDLTKYCVNGFGDIMTVNGLVLVNQSDFDIETLQEKLTCTFDDHCVYKKRDLNTTVCSWKNARDCKHCVKKEVNHLI